jgi:hypothetical protein
MNLYGGSGTRRHLLSSVQGRLVEFLLLVNNMNLDYEMIFNSFKDKSSYLTKIDRYITSLILDRKYLDIIGEDRHFNG